MNKIWSLYPFMTETERQELADLEARGANEEELDRLKDAVANRLRAKQEGRDETN